jgi:hypothetical protein
MKTYDEADYANNRLRDTLVRLKDGTPIQILIIHSSTQVVYMNLLNKQEKICTLADLNIDPVPLGYCNAGQSCTYLVRMPMRQDWKQGLRSNSLRDINGRKVDINIYTIAQTIIGKFPSFSEAIDKVLNTTSKNPFNTEARKPKAVAFNRDFCVKEDKLLEYKGVYIVGTFNSNGGYDLKDRFGWVEDCLKLAI